MANTKSAQKALRHDKKRQLINTAVKLSVKKMIKDARTAIETKSEKAQALIKTTNQTIDKAVQKGVFKKNTGNRKKSRLTKTFNVKFGIGKKNS